MKPSNKSFSNQEDKTVRITSTREITIDQLGRVNGGSSSEVSNDSIFFHQMGLMEKYFERDEVVDDWENCSERVDE